MSSKKSAYCFLNNTPIRSEASEKAEMVTQILFGEIVEILEEQENWMYIRTFMDNYDGWVDRKALRKLTDKEVHRWLDGQSPLFSESIYVLSENGKQLLTKGAFLTYGATESFSIGNTAYTLMSAPEFYNQLDVVQVAKAYLNTPYLWGGKSNTGIDCSGLVQMVYRFCGINLPRDASQQVEYGQDVTFDDVQAGDLAFFKSKDEKIVHVGIIMENNEIIHASGRVRIDELRTNGIYAEEYERFTHDLHSIRRVI